MEDEYFRVGNNEGVKDCLRLENLMNYFKDELCDENN